MMLRFILLLSCFYISFELLSQGVDTIYIQFEEDCPNSFFSENEDRITFILYPSINQSRFIHNKGSNMMKRTCCIEIKNRLISKTKLNELAIELHIEQQKEFEKETGLKGLPPVIPSLNLNALFNKLYIYKSIDENCGIIYEVKWIPAI